MDKILVAFISGSISGSLVAIFYSWLANFFSERRDRRKEFNQAANIFRNKVLSILEGIYPVIYPWWDESLFPKFQQSITKIDTAGAKFSHSIKHQTELNAAIKDYRDYCQQRKYEKGAPHMTYENSPALPKPETDPIEEFKIIVEHILSFANVKE